MPLFSHRAHHNCVLISLRDHMQRGSTNSSRLSQTKQARSNHPARCGTESQSCASFHFARVLPYPGHTLGPLHCLWELLPISLACHPSLPLSQTLQPPCAPSHVLTRGLPQDLCTCCFVRNFPARLGLCPQMTSPSTLW